MSGTPDIYRFAVSNMCRMIFQGAINQDGTYQTEQQQWLPMIDEETPGDALLVLSECIEEELREEWTFSQYGRSHFLSLVAAHIGEGFESVLFYQLVKDIWNRINKEDEDDKLADTYGGQDK